MDDSVAITLALVFLFGGILLGFVLAAIGMRE